LSKASGKKIAVVVIHGIGEQRPMETLPEFVKAVWGDDAELVHPSRAEVFSKPELVSGSYELRRITTRQASAGTRQRMDFFEFYWAHHMQGHTVAALLAWLKDLFVRHPRNVPERLLGVWSFGCFLLLTTLALAILWFAQDQIPGVTIHPWLVVGLPILASIGGLLLTIKILPYAGDAARYLSAAPGNVAVRQQIRKEGVELLETLSASNDYDRIVIVGHSLGSVIAYDIVNFLWNRLPQAACKKYHAANTPAAAALHDVELAGLALRDAAPKDVGTARVAYREAQRAYFAELSADDDPLWLVSDLVTLGSPLSKADVLMAANSTDLDDRKERRELPTSPPIFEAGENGGKPIERFSYPLNSDSRRPHHAAVFAPVVWTNVYVPYRRLIRGDIISGKVSPLFGRGALDVEIQIGEPPGFRHTNYWHASIDDTANETLKALRQSLNLAGHHKEQKLWGDRKEDTPILAKEL